MLTYSYILVSSHNIADFLTVLVSSHNIAELKAADLRELLTKNIRLGRLGEGWTICELVKEPADWEVLARAALHRLDVDFAIRVYRHTSNISMVWSLESIRGKRFQIF